MIVSPLLLELGVHPLVAAATSSLMVREPTPSLDPAHDPHASSQDGLLRHAPVFSDPAWRSAQSHVTLSAGALLCKLRGAFVCL